MIFVTTVSMREPRARLAQPAIGMPLNCRAYNFKNIMVDPSQGAKRAAGYEAVSKQHLKRDCIFEERK